MMIVKDTTKKPRAVNFVDLKIGDVFKWNNSVCIKINAFNQELSNVIYYNCSVKNWQLFNLNQHTIVYPVDAELVIGAMEV